MHSYNNNQIRYFSDPFPLSSTPQAARSLSKCSGFPLVEPQTSTITLPSNTSTGSSILQSHLLHTNNNNKVSI